MNELISTLPSLGFACSGMACFRLSQHRAIRFVPVLRLVGTLLILASLFLAVHRMGSVAGAAAFCAGLTAGILALAFLEPIFPRIPVVLGIAGLLAAFVLFK